MVKGDVMTDRVRILCLARSGDLIGGAQIQYQYLIEGLNRSGYEPLVLTPAAGPISDALARAGPPYLGLPLSPVAPQ